MKAHKIKIGLSIFLYKVNTPVTDQKKIGQVTSAITLY